MKLFSNIYISIFVQSTVSHDIKRRSADPGQQGDDDEASGAVYTRWGRSECPGEAKLVYEGIFTGIAMLTRYIRLWKITIVIPGAEC